MIILREAIDLLIAFFIPNLANMPIFK